MFSPVYDTSDTPIAILGATIYCSTLADLFTSAHYGDDAQLFLVDMRDGKLVLDKWHTEPGTIYDMQMYEAPAQYQGKDFIADMMAGNAGTLTYPSQAYEQTSYASYGPVKNTDFTLTMVILEDVAFAAVHDLRDTLMWVGLIEFSLLLLFAVWIYLIMRRSVQNEKRAKEAELALLHRKEQEPESQFAAATDRREFLEAMAVNLPGGYHRCTTDHMFSVTFISNSFTHVTGYTMEELQDELGGSYMGIVAPEESKKRKELYEHE